MIYRLVKGNKIKSKRNRKDSLTVYRLDFSAKIKTDEGYKQVIIELQKAKFPTDIMRFRKHLGHKDLKNNQIYAKVIDQKKQEVTEKIGNLISIT